MSTTLTTQGLTQLEFDESDFPIAQKIATALGYEQTAYTSTSALWGMFCLPESPETVKGRKCGKCQDRPGFDGLGRACKYCRGSGWLSYPKARARTTGGCIIKTQELGFLFVQSLEDLNIQETELSS